MSCRNTCQGFVAFAALSLMACYADAPSDEVGPTDADDSHAAVLSQEEGAEAPPPPSSTADAATGCTLAPDCLSVPITFVNLEACCTPTTSCGFQITGGTPEIRDSIESAVGLGEGETCAPRERYFIKHPSPDDMRVSAEDDGDILLSAACDSSSFLSITFGGCCMPNNRCGLATYGVWDTLAVLAPDAPFGKLQCTSTRELNAQIESSSLRGLGHLQDTDAPCDYAALDAQLPPLTYQRLAHQ